MIIALLALHSMLTILLWELIQWANTPATPNNWSIYSDIMETQYRVISVDPAREVIRYKLYTDDTDKNVITCSISKFHKLKLTKVS